jgi:hypothetical protein
MNRHILYLGDTALREAACYLAGVMSHSGIPFDYAPSDNPFSDAWCDAPRRAVLLSDYPARNLSVAQQEELARRVADGMGLLMIGGWESFTGAGGDYGATALAEVLPVAMSASDDRVNWAHPCVVEKACDHPVLQGLPFDRACPSIGGFNRISVRPGADLILNGRRFTASNSSGRVELQAVDPPDPLLVLGRYGKGRVAAYASDVAPHWVGGMVDWGDSRVCACAEGSAAIEVGNWYVRFLSRLILWTAGER